MASTIKQQPITPTQCEFSVHSNGLNRKKFKDGASTHSRTIYNVEPDELWEVIDKAVCEYCDN